MTRTPTRTAVNARLTSAFTRLLAARAARAATVSCSDEWLVAHYELTDARTELAAAYEQAERAFGRRNAQNMAARAEQSANACN